MTRDEILAMKSGPELDVLVAEKVLWLIKDDVDRNLFKAAPRRYSTDISAAFEAEEIAIEKDPAMYAHALASVVFGYSQVQDISEVRKMCMLIHATPEQRCKAALLAVMEG